MSQNETKNKKKSKGATMSPTAQKIIYGIMLLALIVLPSSFRMVAMLFVPVLGLFIATGLSGLFGSQQSESTPQNSNPSADSSDQNAEDNKAPQNYIWQLIVLVTIVVAIIVTLFQTDDFLMNLFIYFIIGLVAYAILTGQGGMVNTGKLGKGSNDPNKRGSIAWKKANGVEYVVSANCYRDKNGNYYDLNHIPIPAPVEIKVKKK